jgi:hypothetical protein
LLLGFELGFELGLFELGSLEVSCSHHQANNTRSHIKTINTLPHVKANHVKANHVKANNILMPTTSTPTTRAPTDKPTTHTPTSGERFLKILFSHDLKIFFVLDFYITGKNPKNSAIFWTGSGMYLNRMLNVTQKKGDHGNMVNCLKINDNDGLITYLNEIALLQPNNSNQKG